MNKQDFRNVALCLIGYVAIMVVLAVTHIWSSGSSEPQAARATVQIFTAKWCHNCPTDADIERLRNDYPGVDFEKVDVDERPDLKEKYHVGRVPFFMVCTDTQCMPMHSLGELREWLNGAR